MKKRDYHRLLSTFQSATRSRPVDRSGWHSCERCGQATPVAKDRVVTSEGTIQQLDTVTYVCAHCGHCHVGQPLTDVDTTSQVTCHECHTDLGGAYQCPNCHFPRGWMSVACPHCGHRQPIHVPHWVVGCDL